MKADFGKLAEVLKKRCAQEIDAQYEHAYIGGEDPLGKDFKGWENEGVWPPDEPEQKRRLRE